MNSLILFFKGFIIGLGKVIPGVSGSLLAISLGVYEKALHAIQNLWKEKRNFFFLLPIGIGILLAVFLGSKVLLNLLNKYYIFTVTVFIGLIVGTVPPIIKNEKIEKKDFLFILGIVFALFLLDTKLSLGEFTPANNGVSFFIIFCLGIIDAMTTVLPGISGTATFMMLGCYTFILKLFSNPFDQIFYCFLFGCGLLLGVVGMVYLVNYAFSHFRHLTWICILGFLFSSILSLFLRIIDFLNHENLFACFLLFLIGYTFMGFFRKD